MSLDPSTIDRAISLLRKAAAGEGCSVADVWVQEATMRALIIHGANSFEIAVALDIKGYVTQANIAQILDMKIELTEGVQEEKQYARGRRHEPHRNDWQIWP